MGRTAECLEGLSFWDIFERAPSDGALTIEQLVEAGRLDGNRLYRDGEGILRLCAISAGFRDAGAAHSEFDLRVSDPADAHASRSQEESGDSTIPLGVAAQRLGVSVSTLRRWSDRGRLSTVRTDGGHRRVRRSDIEREHQRLFPGPTVRTPREPIAALPTVGRVILERTALLHELTLRSTYAGNDHGWFATAEGSAELDLWFTELAEGLRGGDFDRVAAVTSTLLRDAREGGAQLLERVALLEGACQAVGAVLESQRLGADELRDWARVDRNLRRRALA